MLKWCLVLAIFFALIPAGLGQEIENSEAVSYLHAEVTRSGSVYLFDNSPFQSARELKITLTVPQNTTRQKSFIKSVEGPDKIYVSEDQWGNKLIVLYWQEPTLKRRLQYTLVSEVEVWEGEEPAKGLNFPQTGFTKSNQEIDKAAYDVSYGLEDIQKIFRLTEWVHYNLKYDNAAKSFSESAEWAYKNRRGACDEFSNLLVSMLRVVGYSPRYVVGYAYSEEWGQHGWVEVDHQGKSVSLDPTWLESPVDSTHIKVAELPDSNISENVEVKGGQITIDWSKGEPEVRVIEHRKSAKIDIGATLIPEKSGDSSYFLLLAEFLSRPECMLTNVQAKGCIKPSGESFLWVSQANQTLAFCGRQKAYWFLKSPEIEEGMVYTCPVVIYGGGAEKTVTTTTEAGLRKNLKTTLKSQSVLTPGEIFEVRSFTENTGHSTQEASIYLFFSGQVQSKDFTLTPGDQAEIKWTLKAPPSPGNYELQVFSSSGDLTTQNITVISQRHAQIENISTPDSAFAGEDISINVTVKALAGFSGVLKTTIDSYADTKWVSLGPSESKRFWLSYTTQSPGTKTISITLLSDSQQYEDGWWGTLEIKNQKQWWDEIAEWFEGIIDWVVGIFTGGE